MAVEKYINPFTDFGFKRMFGSKDSKEFLIDFLNALLADEKEETIVDITYENPEKLGLSPEDRGAIFDLYCTTDTGGHIIVEMQNAKQTYFVDRSIYYATYPIRDAAQAGKWDYKLPKVYTVALLNFTLSGHANDGYKHVIRLIDTTTGRVFYDKLTLIFLEMPKYLKTFEQTQGTQDEWLWIIQNMNKLSEYPTSLQGRLYQRFFRLAEISMLTRDERMAYENSLKIMRDYDNCIHTAQEEGRAEGRAEGANSKAFEIAVAMKKNGFDCDTIVNITGLSPDEIAKI